MPPVHDPIIFAPLHNGEAGTELTPFLAYLETPIAQEYSPHLPLPEQPGLIRRCGNFLLRTLVGQQERDTRTEAAASLLGRLTTKLETKTEVQRQRLIEETKAGDKTLLLMQAEWCKTEYTMAARKFERLTTRTATYTARARQHEERGGIYGIVLGWINRGFAAYCGWRAKSAAQRRDYYLAGTTEA